MPLGDKALLGGGATEIAFQSPHMLYTEVDRGYFPYQIGYANDGYVDASNPGTTKLIGIQTEGFPIAYASLRNTGIYGVLGLQGWTGNTPPTKNAPQLSIPKWNAAAFTAALQ
jgi:hypothetical protein